MLKSLIIHLNNIFRYIQQLFSKNINSEISIESLKNFFVYSVFSLPCRQTGLYPLWLKKKLFIILFLIFSFGAFAQLTDNFEDGNISNWTESNVSRWAASDISPINGTYSLHHVYDNASADTDQVSIALPVMDITTQNTSWRFRIKYTYNPSGGNNWSVFLMTDADASQMKSSGIANGYALGVNYTGSDDTLRLYRITSGISTEIISTTINWDDDISTSQIPALEVIRTNTGEWEVKFNIDGDFDNLQNIGNGTDNTYTTANYFGLYYLYTSSADRNLWIDDIYIGKEIKDTVLPEIDSLYIINSNTLKIEYSEEIDSTIVVNILNYTINGGVGNPDSVLIDESHRIVELYLNQKLEDQQQYSITVQTIEDLEGNVITDTTLNFVYEYIKPLNIEILTTNELLVQFSRELDSVSAENALNYSLDYGLGNPVLADVLFNDSSKVQLQFGSEFTNKTNYKLTVQNIAGQNLDSLQTEEITFLYFIPETYDVVINEIMADPYPEVNLPNYEYIEIKNTTEFDIDLTGWKLKSGSVERDFPSGLIDSASYLIICSNNAEEYLKDYGEVLEFSSFPSITNSGTSIVIYNESNHVIDSVKFTSIWYADEVKNNGGWSLERIDPLNTCSGITNWQASENDNGGTPGIANSVFASNIDNEAPEVEKIVIINDTLLKIHFNEPLEQISASEILNYSVDNGIGNPSSLVIANNLMEVDLTFSNGFTDSGNYTLTFKNLEDWCGNFITEKNQDFAYYIPKPYDIVINEIMADPNPVLGLPEFEYIEVLNTTEHDINMTNWNLLVGSSSKIFPEGVIKSGEYIILCHKDAELDLQNYGTALTMSSFPSLSNSGQELVIQNVEGEIISSVIYTDEWYKDDYKAEGGWSLEQIDPMNPCGGENNWKASEDTRGGTPGQINSINASNPDLSVPELLRISVVDNKNIQLYFSESLDSVSAMETNNYSVDNGIGNPSAIYLIAPNYASLLLEFGESFSKNTKYELEILGNISDCAGNIIVENSTASFAIPDSIEPNDIVINEILFNPLVGGYDFVEIYNRSNKTLDLSKLLIATYDDVDMDFSDVVNITTGGFLIFPEEYYVLTENTLVVKEQYITTNSDAFIQVKNLPSYNDDKGRVILLDLWQNPIDNFEYKDEMHFPLLATNEGVSLERINFDRATDDKTNWHSASELVGFATPAYENSQYMESSEIPDEVKIEPEVFSPDNDGFEDFTNIQFTFNEPGYVANIKIFDSRGRLIRYLTNNQLLGINGVITWDGLDENNQKAPVGIYVIFIEVFDMEGNIKQFKKSVVVAAKY